MDLARRSQRFAEISGLRAFATAGLRPAAGRGREPHRQAAGRGVPFVCADLFPSCRATRDVANARPSAPSASSARDHDSAARPPI
jgi:hypothetical protein